jgi:sucrose-6-phosphate hydrolase SacC (GH32 family)
MELYRAANEELTKWEYVGPFYTGTGSRPAHHPNIFFVDDKVVLWSCIPIDQGSDYTIGRIENRKFVKEAVGHWGVGSNVRASVIYESNDGRVLLWALFWGLRDEDNTTKEKMRAGWDNSYSLPREVGLRDNRLTFTPAEEIKELRTEELAHAAEKELAEGDRFSPALNGDASQFELSCRIAFSADAKGGIELKGDENDIVRIYYDRSTSRLALDTTGARHASFDYLETHAAKDTPVALDDGALDVRLFFDHSVIEVYANGTVSSVRWLPESPENVQVGVFSEKGQLRLSELRIWQMGTIWKGYMEQ